MERLKHLIGQTVTALLPIILGYGAVLGVLIILTELVPGTRQIAILFFQFSWPVVIAWGGVRVVRLSRFVPGYGGMIMILRLPCPLSLIFKN